MANHPKKNNLELDDLLGIKFPNYLKEFTKNKYQIFSSAVGQMAFLPLCGYNG